MMIHPQFRVKVFLWMVDSMGLSPSEAFAKEQAMARAALHQSRAMAAAYYEDSAWLLRNHGARLPTDVLPSFDRICASIEREKRAVAILKDLRNDSNRVLTSASGLAHAVVCRKCRSSNVLSQTKLMRSADEPETVFYMCLDCHNKWRVG